MIQSTSLEAVKDAVNIMDVINSFGNFQLSKNGSGYKMKCPFHDENTDSFYVKENSKTYKCFGCGVYGDAIDFVQKHTHTDFINAVKYVAKIYNIPVEEGKETPEQQAQFERKELLRVVMKVAQAQFSPRENAGMSYFLGRGFKPETLERFGIGYATGEETRNLPYEKDILQAAGLINKDQNPIIWKRATIPIMDKNGDIVAFAGRTIDGGEIKYINSQESELYTKSKTLYNLHNALRPAIQKRQLLITEGYPDVFTSTEEGVPEIVATCGTALTLDHVALLCKTFQKSKIAIILAYNNDRNKAGQKAMLRAIPMLLPYFNVRVLKLPQNDLEDCRNDRNVIFQQLVLDHIDGIEYYAECRSGDETDAKKRAPIDQAEIQAEIAGLIAKVANDAARDLYINNLSDRLLIKPKKLADLVENSRGGDAQEKNKESQINNHKIIKIKDDFYERQPQVDLTSKTTMNMWVRRAPAELERENWKGFLKSVPRYHNWITIPNHVNYKQEIEIQEDGETYRFFNEYKPLPMQSKPFDLPEGWKEESYDYEKIPEIKYTARFYKHIYNAKKYGLKYVNLGWDYVTIMYLHPERPLQARCFVSKEEATGKSTMFYYEQALFGQNATKTTAKRLIGNFNSELASKVLIAIEETKDDKGTIENDLKDLITGHEKVIEGKFQDAKTSFSFEKYLFLSNHPASFMKVGAGTTRFIVVDVPKVEEMDNNLLEKMIREIPYVMYFMQKRGIQTPDTDRLWFDPKLWENDALRNLRVQSKDIVVQNIELLIQDIFIKAKWAKPELKLGGKLLAKYMSWYAGQKYKDHPPTYFTQACKNSMNLKYKETPTLYVFPKFTGFSEGETFEYTEERDKDRFIIFPIWNFLTARQAVIEFGELKARVLAEEIERDHSNDPEAVKFGLDIHEHLYKTLF